MKIPKTAQEQLLLAREMGHEFSIETRGPWPELGDPHPKYYIRCTCGWAPSANRSKRGANGRMAMHLGRVIADNLDRVNGG